MPKRCRAALDGHGAQAVPAQIESEQLESATTSALAPGVAPLGNAFQAPPRSRGTQALTGALSVSGFDSPYLRGVDWDLAAQPAPDYEIGQRVNG